MPSWIDDTAFDGAVLTLKQRAEDALLNAEKRRRKNAIDPFQTLLLASTFDVVDSVELARLQQVESAMRGMSNALGEFHQSVLGSVKGWENHDSGYDLRCAERRIIAEVKNKWNTMNSSNRQEVENNLASAIRNLKGPWTAYLVQVIPRKPHRYQETLRNNVISTDGATFYEIVTGSPNAIHDLFDELIDRLAPSENIGAYCRQIMFQSLPPRD